MDVPQQTHLSKAGIALLLGGMLTLSACSIASPSRYELPPAASPALKAVQLLPELPQPASMTVDASLDSGKATAMAQAAQRFYAFWNTGDESLIPQAVSGTFTDNTLPKGRPQGPDGLKFASAGFRKAVPDLQCRIEDLLIVGDKVTARLVFTGTHRGEFAGKAPTGKAVRFIATDILRIRDGKIIEDWHLEDNLTLMQQLGVVEEN